MNKLGVADTPAMQRASKQGTGASPTGLSPVGLVLQERLDDRPVIVAISRVGTAGPAAAGPVAGLFGFSATGFS
jgi:hypothetical protein